MMNESQLVRRIKAHIEKGDKAADKADDHYKAAGIHLKELKSAHAGTWAEWEELLKTRIGIGKSRASELMQIADGTKTIEGTRTQARERMKAIRARSPERSGENADEPGASAADMKAKFAAADATAEEDPFLDDDGNFAPDDPAIDTACRIGGFLYRAQQSAFGAETTKLKNLVCTQEMLEAAQRATQAWNNVSLFIQARLGGNDVDPEQSADNRREEFAAEEVDKPGAMPPIPDFLRRTPKVAAS